MRGGWRLGRGAGVRGAAALRYRQRGAGRNRRRVCAALPAATTAADRPWGGRPRRALRILTRGFAPCGQRQPAGAGLLLVTCRHSLCHLPPRYAHRDAISGCLTVASAPRPFTLPPRHACRLRAVTPRHAVTPVAYAPLHPAIRRLRAVTPCHAVTPIAYASSHPANRQLRAVTFPPTAGDRLRPRGLPGADGAANVRNLHTRRPRSQSGMPRRGADEAHLRAQARWRRRERDRRLQGNAAQPALREPRAAGALSARQLVDGHITPDIFWWATQRRLDAFPQLGLQCALPTLRPSPPRDVCGSPCSSNVTAITPRVRCYSSGRSTGL